MPLLYNAPLFWPAHREHIWTYCIYLGPYTSPENQNYDLGIYISPKDMSVQTVSAAITFGNDPHEYFSGPIDHIGGWESNPQYKETYQRAMALKLHPTMYGGRIGGIFYLRKDYQRLLEITDIHGELKWLQNRKITIENLFKKHNIPLTLNQKGDEK